MRQPLRYFHDGYYIRDCAGCVEVGDDYEACQDRRNEYTEGLLLSLLFCAKSQYMLDTYVTDLLSTASVAQ